MKVVHKEDGVVTLLHPTDDVSTSGVDCLMCAYEPVCYDTVADFLPDGSRAAEIGCFLGGSACILWHGMTRRGKRLMLACHDLFQPFEVNGEVHDIESAFDANTSGWNVDVVKIKGDSKKTHDVHQDASLDYCFVDGDHSYEGALADIKNFWPKMKRGGFFLVQDSIGDVEKAVEAALCDVPKLLIHPPYGHFITVCNQDTELLQAFGKKFERAMSLAVSQSACGGPFTI